MKTVFADACYWIALLNPKDSLHSMARAASNSLGPCRIVTTEMVLVELLNGLSSQGDQLRRVAADTIAGLSRDANVDVIPQTSLQFRSAVARYCSRLDKEWGATDCASFVLMEDEGITDALTDDHHFEQAGFKILMRASDWWGKAGEDE